MNKHSEYLFKKLGKGSGFTSAAHVKSVMQGLVLDAKGGRRVFLIQDGGTAELVGLNITVFEDF